MTVETADALQVGDVVELAEPVAHVRGVPVRARGRVLVEGLPWGCVTVAFGPIATDPDAVPGRTWMIRGGHLRRVVAP